MTLKGSFTYFIISNFLLEEIMNVMKTIIAIILAAITGYAAIQGIYSDAQNSTTQAAQSRLDRMEEMAK